MKIITNFDSRTNHFTQLKKNISKCDKLILASPFLMGDFGTFFNDLDLKSLKEIHLITTLKPKSFDQIKKVGSFLTLIELPIIKNKTVNFKISVNNRLHGKVYIFKARDKYLSSILTSANFTDSGLSSNHEWGVEITDKKLIKELEKTLNDSLEVDSISRQKIINLSAITNSFLSKNPTAEQREIDLDLTKQLKYKSKVIRFDDSRNFWLKPIGVYGNPVLPNRKFSSKKYDLHFSKIRPTGVKINDIVICYGVGLTKVLSIYKTTSLPKLASPKSIKKNPWHKRWPWYINSINMTPNYGAKWTNFDLRIGQLASDFLKIPGNKGILANGSNSLGGLMWGKDKLLLTSEFAQYIIDLVNSHN